MDWFPGVIEKHHPSLTHSKNSGLHLQNGGIPWMPAVEHKDIFCFCVTKRADRKILLLGILLCPLPPPWSRADMHCATATSPCCYQRNTRQQDWGAPWRCGPAAACDPQGLETILHWPVEFSSIFLAERVKSKPNSLPKELQVSTI